MKPHIGVMELHNHPEIIYSEASLAKYCGAKVTIFTTEKLKKRTLYYINKKEDYFWVLKQDKETLRHFLKRVENYCDKNIDILLLNTFYVLPYQQILYFLFSPKCRIVHVVGRVERLFGELKAIKFGSFKAFILSVSYNISQFIRKKTLNKFGGLWAENKDAYQEIISKGYNKEIACFFHHYCYNDIVPYSKNDDKLSFVVIGGLKNFRRDYNGLLDAFKKLADSDLKKISLILLGAPDKSKNSIREEGLKIISEFKKLKEKGLDLIYYTEWVSEEELRLKVSSADIIINPSCTNTYGTGSSGAIFNAIRFSKPAIFPKGSLHHEELASSTISYSEIEELSEIIISLLNNRDIVRELSENAIDNSRKFSIKKMAKNFRDSFL